MTTDSSILTAVGNDFSIKEIFKRQTEALVRKNDVLWAFSTSGTSANILAAAEVARENGAKILAFTGKANTPLEQISDVCVAVPAPTASSAQEIHQLAYHIICDLVESHFA